MPKSRERVADRAGFDRIGPHLFAQIQHNGSVGAERTMTTGDSGPY